MNSIPFQFDTKYGQFCDALILSDEELATLTEADIETMKQQRLTNWIQFIENPVVVEYTDVVEDPQV
jgi:hypothetical protein